MVERTSHIGAALFVALAFAATMAVTIPVLTAAWAIERLRGDGESVDG